MADTVFQEVEKKIESAVFGQSQLVNRMLVCLLANGHLLIEGLPGLAKTRAVKVLSEAIRADFKRIQFTPDLLPADLTGTEIYDQSKQQFVFIEGPLFNNVILADEINRAPAKVQSALLEAMGEYQITIGKETRKLAEPFMVIATQNPLDNEGTYGLPEAQLDRFLLHTEVHYPSYETEKAILGLVRNEESQVETSEPIIGIQQIMDWRQQLADVHIEESLVDYIVRLVRATRKGTDNKQLEEWIEVGAGPRACIALDKCARAQAFIDGRDHVLPDDILDLLQDVLRHRMVLSFEAEAAGVDKNKVLEYLVESVPVH